MSAILDTIKYTDRKREVAKLMQREFSMIPFSILDEKDWEKMQNLCYLMMKIFLRN